MLCAAVTIIATSVKLPKKVAFINGNPRHHDRKTMDISAHNRSSYMLYVKHSQALTICLC